MSERAVSRMTAGEFLEWCLHQEGRFELVNGVPVAMAGAKQRHDRIVINAQFALTGWLRGKTCRTFSADIGIRIPAGNVRRPDVGVDYGPPNDEAMDATAPVVAIEVLSPSTRDFDRALKLAEYKTVASLAHIVLVDPDQPRVIRWSRAPGGTWQHKTIEGLDARIAFPEIDYGLPIAELYEGLTFRPAPRLVQDP